MSAPSKCRSCGADIWWATHDTTNRPVPTVKHAGGNLRVYRAPDGARRCLHVDAGTGNAVSHFADCPNASVHRRPKDAA